MVQNRLTLKTVGTHLSNLKETITQTNRGPFKRQQKTSCTCILEWRQRRQDLYLKIGLTVIYNQNKKLTLTVDSV